MISRRSLLQRGATVTALAGLAVATVQCQPTEAPAAVLVSAAMSAAIERHRQATIDWLAAIDVLGDLDERDVAGARAARLAGATQPEWMALRQAFKKTPAYVAADERYCVTCDAERDALGSLVDEPVVSAADMRAKLEYLLALPDADENLDMVEDVATRLMRSLLNGGLV